MEEIGMWLQRERIARGVTLDAIRDETKIGAHYLQALEDGATHRLPGDPYVKAYIRAYSQVVGIDCVPILHRYTELQMMKAHAEELKVRRIPKTRRFIARINQTLQWLGL